MIVLSRNDRRRPVCDERHCVERAKDKPLTPVLPAAERITERDWSLREAYGRLMPKLSCEHIYKLRAQRASISACRLQRTSGRCLG
jgi:hypothetical protein